MCKEKQRAHQERASAGQASSNIVLSLCAFLFSLHLVFCILKQTIKGHVFGSRHLFLPLDFSAQYHTPPYILLSLSFFWLLSSFVTQPVPTWTRNTWTPPVAAVTWMYCISSTHGTQSWLKFTHSLFTTALSFSSLYLSPPMLWPQLYLVPAGSLTIWKIKSSMASIVPVKLWHNGCWESLWYCG